MNERDPHKPPTLGISTHGDLDGKWVRQKDYDSLRAELATNRDRHAADARDLDQLRITVRDESQRAHDAEVELDTLRAGVASWKAEEEAWKAREAELIATLEVVREERTSAFRQQLEAADRYVRAEKQRDALADALLGAHNAGALYALEQIDREKAEALLRLTGRLPEDDDADAEEESK